MIVTLTGTNDFARQAELMEHIAAFLSKNDPMGLEKLDGEEVDFQRICDALTSLPFLVDRKLVVLRSPSANKAYVENAEKLLSDLPETTDVVVVEPKLDRRTSYYKFLKAATDFREFGELDTNGLVRWIVEYVKRGQGSFSAPDARFLIERVGSSQLIVKNEVDKLLLHDPQITRETILLLTEPTPQSTVFELLDAAFGGDKKKALRLYEEQRTLKVEQPQILALVAWQLHVLAVIKTAGERTVDEIAREAKLNPFVIRKSISTARQITLSDLKKRIREALALDIRLKSEVIDADEALQLFLLRVSG
jgi:DNA polymerase-3 subunit delta